MTTRQARGFTAVEILMALAVLGILAALAAPSFRDFANEQRLSSAISGLASDLQFARSEAIKRNGRVLICSRTPGTTNCAAAPNWKDGWVVCYDADGDDQCDATQATDVNPMRQATALHPRLQLAGTAPIVRFNAVGAANAAVTLTLNGDWTGSSTRTATVATTGTVTVRRN